MSVSQNGVFGMKSSYSVWWLNINSSLFLRATPASSPIWTGRKTASTSSPTQETMRSSSVGRLSCLVSRALVARVTRVVKVAFLTCCTHHRRWWNISFSGEASNGKHVTNMDTVRNLEWATSTCTLSFSTFGRSIKYPAVIWSTKACEVNKLTSYQLHAALCTDHFRVSWLMLWAVCSES